MWTMDDDIDGANSQLQYQNALAATRRGDRVKLATSISWHTVSNLPRFFKSEAPISQCEDKGPVGTRRQLAECCELYHVK
jgi:hypothetical protein